MILLGYLGTSGERTDVMAHLGGFVAGILVGAVLSRMRAPERLSPGAQLALGLLAPVMLAVAWAAALA